LAEIQTRLGSHAAPVAVQIPIGAGPPHVQNAFAGVIDLIEMKRLTFSGKDGEKVGHEEIPEAMLETARRHRAKLLEKLYDFSDQMMELALGEQEIPIPLIRKVLRAATVQNLVVPVFCGSALDRVGVQPVLDAVQHYLPSPADLPPVEGTDPANPEKKLKRQASVSEPFCGLVFKIVADKHGDLCFVRVYSGELQGNSRVLNPGKDKKENVPQLWHVQASRRQQVKSVEAGDIVAVVGLPASITGDTLCDTRHPILLEPIQFPETVISMAIEPESSAERKKLAERLEMLKRQDPTFRALESEETGQTIISGMGELHLEIIKNRLLRDFNLNVKVHNPRVSYRETVKQRVEVAGECRRQIAGKNTFAKVKIRLEPDPGGESVRVDSAARQQLLDEFVTAAVESLNDQRQGGGSLGHPLVHVKITLQGGEQSESESTDVAFRIAAADAFNKALREAGIVLLEPIMRLEINTPEDHLGTLVADLQQRRGTITRTDVRGRFTVIEAHVPLATLFGYTSDMRSLSGGLATSTMEPSHYGPAPPGILESFL
jgi:elongation factor G